MKVIMFQPRFAQFVASGEKLQTVRPARIRPISIGDPVSLRRWFDKPYRSAQVEIGRSIVVCVQEFEISTNMLRIDDTLLDVEKQDVFARRDGFQNRLEMREWFGYTHHVLPWRGVVIHWAAL